MDSMTIGKLAKETGIGIETIRYYEREGLLPKAKRRLSSGYREYDSTTVQRLFFVRRAKDLGFSLREIRDLLALRATSKAKCASVKTRAEVKIQTVEQKINELTKIKKALQVLVTSCNAEAPTSECPILDALAGKEAR